MAATVTLRVYTSTNAATESSAITGIDFISADNATNSSGNRVANPITTPAAGVTRSYEKWLKLKIDVAPDNQIDNIQFWTDGSFATGVSIFGGVTATGATPVNTDSSVATTDATTWTSGGKLTWDAGPYTTTGAIDDYLVLQMDVASTASVGNMAQETFTYSYDET